MEAITDLTDEEKLFIMRRREAVKAFIAFCQRPIPYDEYKIAEDDRIQKELEDELRFKWGVNV